MADTPLDDSRHVRPAPAMPTAVSTEDLLVLADRIVAAGEARGLPLPAVGGVAIEMRAPERPPSLRRSYGDLDVAAPANRRREVENAMREAGLIAEERFNKVQGTLRQIWWTIDGRTHVDVFLGEFAMCHRLRFEGRLEAGSPAMPAADLLLMKLQVVELNLKDATDAASLLVTHDLRDSDDDGALNGPYLAAILGDDWGFFTTVSDNLDRLPAILEKVDGALPAPVSAACRRLTVLLEAAPKSRAFRLRARVGRRKRWYELPEESL